MKSVGSDFLDSVVIDQLYNEIFAPRAIERMTNKLDEYASSSSSEISQNIKDFENELSGIQTQINNTVNAIANKMFHPSMN